MKRYTLFLLFFLILHTAFVFGKIETYYVKPIQTDPNYSPDGDSSTISRNTNIQLNKLYVFFGGTNSSSSGDYNAIRIHAAGMGYDFINLSYPNTVAAASHANSSDELVFDKYRQEICFGTPESDVVSVDSLNSIYTRLLKLLQYLDQAHSSENWGQYLAGSNSIEWSKITLGGHSQGSGHACYLAKKYPVDRVLMFSGPNDYSNFYSNSANWLRQPGVTSVSRHFAYLSLNDEVVDFSKQFTNLSGLGMLAQDDTTLVDNIASPYENSHCLYTTQAAGLVLLDHNVPIMLSSINNKVWTYMLEASVITALASTKSNSELSVFPNPASTYFQVKSEQDVKGISYTILDMTGDMVQSGWFSTVGRVDVSRLGKGMYMLRVEGRVVKLVKE